MIIRKWDDGADDVVVSSVAANDVDDNSQVGVGDGNGNNNDDADDYDDGGDDDADG